MADSKAAIPGSVLTESGVKGRRKSAFSNPEILLGVLVRKPDGRTCKLCGRADLSLDPLAAVRGLVLDSDNPTSGVLLAWAYPPDPQSGKSVGHHCFYCNRLFVGKYRAKNFTLASLATHLGSDSKHHQQFLELLKKLEEYIVSQGTRECRLPWTDILERTVTVQDTLESRFEQPDDLYWDRDHYIKERGDPRKNGHAETVRNGMQFVVVPGQTLFMMRAVQA